MTTEPVRFWEDFAVGDRYPTSTRTITEDDLDRFCELVGYDVPLFLDDDQPENKTFKGRICPSHLIMSVATAMTGRLFSESLIGLLGLENGKFLAPVYPGDSLSTEVEVLEKRPTSKPERGIVVFRDHVLNQNGVEVFQVDKITLIRCREAS
ncbi:MAG: dehydratase [Rhodospirillaceae bacterium]|nr:dehydratase [Rhodospirillaceae bacterium]|tara:strand:+ start:3370 stop:3825 length:456 start_codon:yes stop_codon:yes gene_type:complete